MKLHPSHHRRSWPEPLRARFSGFLAKPNANPPPEPWRTRLCLMVIYSLLAYLWTRFRKALGLWIHPWKLTGQRSLQQPITSGNIIVHHFSMNQIAILHGFMYFEPKQIIQQITQFNATIDLHCLILPKYNQIYPVTKWFLCLSLTNKNTNSNNNRPPNSRLSFRAKSLKKALRLLIHP